MFKLLVICVAILVHVDAAPSAEPQGDIFSIFDDIYDYFFESDENLTVENQTIYINCKNCTVKLNLTQSESTQAMVMTTAVPTTAQAMMMTTAVPTGTQPMVMTTAAGQTTTATATSSTTSTMAPELTG